MAALVFDYSVGRAFCEGLGIAFDEGAIPYADAVFAGRELTQEQVSAVVCAHAWIMFNRFKPTTYTRWQRVKMAWAFLRTLRRAQGSV